MMIDPMLNTQFGPYLIQEMLGSGGMAVVYKAQHQKTNKIVALKLLHTAWMTLPEVTQRFQKEAEIARRLNHPCIVAVQGTGTVQGRAYMAMDYLPGGTLAARFSRKTPISSLEAVRMLRRIASALDYAHHQQVIHRDLKLDNILLDGRGDAYLSDFGIARVLGATQMTATGSIIGTPLYMSPEQARGQQDMDYRADLYALAVIGYLMTVGRFPFTGNNPMAILNQQINAVPPKPSDVIPTLSPALDLVLFKGLAKEPQDRYQSADAFIEAYAQALSKTENHNTMIDTRPDADYPGQKKDHSKDEAQRESADKLYEAARTAEDRDKAIVLLKRALELDPWHAKANRALFRLEGAKPSKEDKPVTPLPPQQPLPSFERKLRQDRHQRHAEKRRTWQRVGCAGLLLLSFACSLFTMSLIGLLPGFITTLTTLSGGPTPVVQLNGTPIKDVPNAVLTVQPSQSKPAQQRAVDVLDNGYLHEYQFEAKVGDIVEIYVQFMSLAAKSVTRNVAIVDPKNKDMTSQCERNRILAGDDTNVTFECTIATAGVWKVRVLGRQGESSGAYFVGVQKLNG